MDEVAITINIDPPFRVTDLKQWVYCPRILYYITCLPEVRPTTYKMEAGIEAGREQENRQARRSLRIFGIDKGRCEFSVPVCSAELGLRGLVDMVIWSGISDGELVIPVDYKLSRVSGAHFKMQLVAYGMLLEETYGATARRGYLYFIPTRKAEEFRLDKRIRKKLLKNLESMQRMLDTEEMPVPTSRRGKCVSCEFRRFCNDVV